MEYKENAELCHCKHVTLADIDRALAQTNRFSDVEREFQEVQKITSCSTGCGGCHDKIMGVISGLMSGYCYDFSSIHIHRTIGQNLMLAVCFADFPAIEYTDDSTPNAGNRAIHSLNLLEIRICFAAGWNCLIASAEKWASVPAA